MWLNKIVAIIFYKLPGVMEDRKIESTQRFFLGGGEALTSQTPFTKKPKNKPPAQINSCNHLGFMLILSPSNHTSFS
jgi:hypothetical protein